MSILSPSITANPFSAIHNDVPHKTNNIKPSHPYFFPTSGVTRTAHANKVPPPSIAFALPICLCGSRQKNYRQVCCDPTHCECAYLCHLPIRLERERDRARRSQCTHTVHMLTYETPFSTTIAQTSTHFQLERMHSHHPTTYALTALRSAAVVVGAVQTQ